MRCIISEFHVIETEFTDEECLVGALQDVGYTPEVHDTEVNLNGHVGSGTTPKAHIVIRKGQFGGCGDAGFERVGGGGFKLHADDYDYGRRGYDKLKLTKVKQNYAARVIEKTVRKTSKYSLLSRRTNNEGEIKIRVRRMGN